MFLVSDSPPAKFFITTAIIAVVCFSVLLVIFVPKILNSRKTGGAAMIPTASRFSSTKFFPDQSHRDSFMNQLRKSTGGPVASEDVWINEVNALSGQSSLPRTSSIPTTNSAKETVAKHDSTSESEEHEPSHDEMEDTKES